MGGLNSKEWEIPRKSNIKGCTNKRKGGRGIGKSISKDKYKIMLFMRLPKITHSFSTMIQLWYTDNS